MARGSYRPVQPESLEAIAARLYALRKALGASQIQMAQTLGSPANSIWANYEGGTRRISVDHALQLCRLYGVTLEWIYRGHIHSLPGDLADKIRVQEVLRGQRAK